MSVDTHVLLMISNLGQRNGSYDAVGAKQPLYGGYTMELLPTTSQELSFNFSDHNISKVSLALLHGHVRG